MTTLRTQEANRRQWEKDSEKNKRDWNRIFARMSVRTYLRNIGMMLAAYFGIAFGFMLLGWIVTSLT